MPERDEPTAAELLRELEWTLRADNAHLRRILGVESAELVCAECGRFDDGKRGWTMRLDDDQLVTFCPDCDREEFGDAC